LRVRSWPPGLDADPVQATRRGFLARVRELLPTQEPAEQGRALIGAVQEQQFDVAGAVLDRAEVRSNDLGVPWARRSPSTCPLRL